MPSLKTIIVLLLLICVRANVHKQQYVSLPHTNVITTLAVRNRTLTTIAPVNTSTRSMQNATLSAKNAKTAFYSRYEPVRTAVQIFIAVVLSGLCLAIIIAICLWKTHDQVKRNVTPH